MREQGLRSAAAVGCGGHGGEVGLRRVELVSEYAGHRGGSCNTTEVRAASRCAANSTFGTHIWTGLGSKVLSVSLHMIPLTVSDYIMSDASFT